MIIRERNENRNTPFAGTASRAVSPFFIAAVHLQNWLSFHALSFDEARKLGNGRERDHGFRRKTKVFINEIEMREQQEVASLRPKLPHVGVGFLKCG